MNQQQIEPQLPTPSIGTTAPGAPVSFFGHKEDKVPKPMTLTLEALSKTLPIVVPPGEWNEEKQKYDKDCPMWSPATYAPGATRSKATVQCLHFLAVDIDDDDSKQKLPSDAYDRLLVTLKECASGFGACLQTSYNHTPAHPRVRITVQLSRWVTPAEYHDLWLIMCNLVREALGGSARVDPSTKDVSRCYFIPAVPNQVALTWYRSELTGEAPVNVEHWLSIAQNRVPQLPAPSAPANDGASQPMDLASFMANPTMAKPAKNVRCPSGAAPDQWFETLCSVKHPPAVSGESGQSELLRLANYGVVGLDLDPVVAAEIAWEHYNPRCDPPWAENERSSFERKFTEAKPQGDAQQGYLLPSGAIAAHSPSRLSPVAEGASPEDRLGTVLDVGAPVPKLRRAIDGLPFHFGAVNAIVGYAGDGKTPLLASIVTHLASGKPWFGRNVEQGSVLVLTYEAPLSFLRHIQRYAAGIGVDCKTLPIKFISCDPGALSDPAYVDHIRDHVAPRYSYIAIDTYGAGMTGVEQNESTFAVAAKRLEREHVAVITALHTNKAGDKPSLKSIAGTGALAGAIKAAIGVWRPEPELKDVFEIVSVRSPDNGFTPVRCKIDDRGDVDGPWHYAEIKDSDAETSNVTGAPVGNVDQRILDKLRTHSKENDWVSSRDIADALNLDIKLVDEAAKRLAEIENIEHRRHGYVHKWRRHSQKFPAVIGTTFSAPAAKPSHPEAAEVATTRALFGQPLAVCAPPAPQSLQSAVTTLTADTRLRMSADGMARKKHPIEQGQFDTLRAIEPDDTKVRAVLKNAGWGYDRLTHNGPRTFFLQG